MSELFPNTISNGAVDLARKLLNPIVNWRTGTSEVLARQADQNRLLDESWTATLSTASRALLVVEYGEALRLAQTAGRWDDLDQLLTEWRDTALVESDSELMARILDTGDPAGHRDMPRPVAQ